MPRSGVLINLEICPQRARETKVQNLVLTKDDDDNKDN